MHYAIISAGEGSRLRQEGIDCPKPLVPIAGEPMLGRLIGLFHRLGAESISVICNTQSAEVSEYLAARCNEMPELQYIVESTPSSMHSLAALSRIIPEGKFCLTTVDTIFPSLGFQAYVHRFEQQSEADGYFAVTPYVDDEKPLWVGVETEAMPRIKAFCDLREELPAGSLALVSGGIYCLDTRTAFPVLRACLEQGQSRMRNYQRALLAAGLRIDACIFPKILDIDHAEDIRKAEEWLKAEESFETKY